MEEKTWQDYLVNGKILNIQRLGKIDGKVAYNFRVEQDGKINVSPMFFRIDGE